MSVLYRCTLTLYDDVYGRKSRIIPSRPHCNQRPSAGLTQYNQLIRLFRGNSNVDPSELARVRIAYGRRLLMLREPSQGIYNASREQKIDVVSGVVQAVIFYHRPLNNVESSWTVAVSRTSFRFSHPGEYTITYRVFISRSYCIDIIAAALVHKIHALLIVVWKCQGLLASTPLLLGSWGGVMKIGCPVCISLTNTTKQFPSHAFIAPTGTTV